MVFNTNILAGSSGQGEAGFSPKGAQIKNTSLGDTNNYIFCSTSNAAPTAASVAGASNKTSTAQTKGTFVMWYHPTAVDGLVNGPYPFGGGSTAFPNFGGVYTLFVRHEDSSVDNIQILPRSASGYIKIVTPTGGYTLNEWNCLMFSFDTASSPTKFRVYINDTQKSSGTVTTASGIQSNLLNASYIGAKVFNNPAFVGAVAEYYLNFGEFVEFDTESERRKFINADGTPVDLGSDGSTPTGTSPMIYLSLREGETADQFAVNRGIGADFTVQGSVSVFAADVSAPV